MKTKPYFLENYDYQDLQIILRSSLLNYTVEDIFLSIKENTI